MHAPDPNAPDDGDCELDALMQDKLETHCRQQLSALVDGALPPDEARFLLRRLQHDDALAGRWERWQVYGECMRGGVSQLLPADFSQRVCAVLEAERVRELPVAAARGVRPVWTRWAGGALAASVAMAALVAVQRDLQGAGSQAQQVASSTPVAAPATAVADAVTNAENAIQASPGAADTAAQSGAAAAGALLLAARDLPRRNASRTAAVRPAGSTVATPAASAPTQPALQQASLREAVAATAVDAEASVQAGRDPFGMEVSVVDPRPWPRAVLPGVAPGGFNVGYGGAQSEAGTFEYFEPRLPADDGQARLPPAADAER